MPDPVHLVIADLELKRAEIDAVLRGLRKICGCPATDDASPVVQGTVVPAHTSAAVTASFGPMDLEPAPARDNEIERLTADEQKLLRLLRPGAQRLGALSEELGLSRYVTQGLLEGLEARQRVHRTGDGPARRWHLGPAPAKEAL